VDTSLVNVWAGDTDVRKGSDVCEVTVSAWLSARCRVLIWSVGGASLPVSILTNGGQFDMMKLEGMKIGLPSSAALEVYEQRWIDDHHRLVPCDHIPEQSIEAVYEVAPYPDFLGAWCVTSCCLEEERPPEPCLALRRSQSIRSLRWNLPGIRRISFDRTCWNSADCSSPRALSTMFRRREVQKVKGAAFKSSSVLVWGSAKPH
jgi:hypothetical protein